MSRRRAGILIIPANPVPHQFERPVRRHETDDFILLEPRIPHAGMETAIVYQVDVVKGQYQIGHAAQIGLRLYGTADIARYDVPPRVQYGVDLFHDIDVYFVVGMVDAGLAPGHIGHGAGGQRLGQYRRRSAADGLLYPGHDGGRSNQIGEGVGFGGQGPAVVDHFFEQLIGRGEIILDGRFVGGIAEVHHERVGHAMQEFDDEQRRRFGSAAAQIGRTGRQVGQTVSQYGKQVDRPAAAVRGRVVHVHHLHHGRHRVVEGDGVVAAASVQGRVGRRDAAVVVQRFGGAGPEVFADGTGGERGSEVPFDEDFARGGEDEERLNHIVDTRFGSVHIL